LGALPGKHECDGSIVTCLSAAKYPRGIHDFESASSIIDTRTNHELAMTKSFPAHLQGMGGIGQVKLRSLPEVRGKIFASGFQRGGVFGRKT
jgi:hypothetical protein